MARKGPTAVIYKFSFVSEQSIFTDFPCNIYRLQKLQGKSVNITGFSLQILQKTRAESL